MMVKLGDGEKTSMWFDNWSNIGSLHRFISCRDIYEANLSLHVIVTEMIHQGEWRWPEGQRNRWPQIDNINVPRLETRINDRMVRKDRNGNEVSFYVNIAWQDI